MPFVLPTFARSWSKIVRSKRFLAGFLGGAIVLPGGPLFATDKHWNTNQGVFQDPTRWNSPGVPAVGDNVYVGDMPGAVNGYVKSAANIAIANLNIAQGMNVLNGDTQFGMITDSYLFGVLGNTTVTGSIGQNGIPNESRLTILDKPGLANEFSTSGLTLSNNAKLVLVDGAGVQVQGLAVFNDATALSANGVLNLTRNGTPALIMDGFITPGATGGLTINQLGTGRIDLDGGVVRQSDNDFTVDLFGSSQDGTQFPSLTINGDQLADAFDEDIRLEGNSSLHMNLSDGWTMNTSSRLIFTTNFDHPGPATITGGALTFQGRMIFDYPNAAQHPTHARIDADTIFTPSAEVRLNIDDRLEMNATTTVDGGHFYVGMRSELQFNGATSVHGGTFSTGIIGVQSGVVDFNGATTWGGNVTIDGYARQHGDATVVGTTTIDADYFDVDGATNSHWSVNAPLTFNVGSLETPFDVSGNQVDGGITINAGVPGTAAYLAVNLPANESWIMKGPLTLHGPSMPFSATTLRGAAVTVQGAMVADGNNTSTARIGVGGTGLVGIAGGGSLRLSGGSLADPNTLAGGAFVGVGKLSAADGKALVGHGSINNPIDFDGSSELRAVGGTLTLTGAIQDVGVIGTADTTGVLQVANAWSSGVADKVELLGGAITGASLSNSGQVVGRGTLGMNNLINDGTLAASGGELLVHTTNLVGTDLDGAAETGIVRAVDGNIRVVRTPLDAFDGTAIVAAGRRLQFDSGWTLRGELAMMGATGNPALLSGGGLHRLEGRVEVTGDGMISSPSEFLSSAEAHLPGPADILRLTAASYVSIGAAITGQGTLENGAGATLTLGNFADVAVGLRNAGTLEIGLASGAASVRGLTLEPTSGLRMGIDGTMTGEWDALAIAETAVLNGLLVVPVNQAGGAYVDPQLPGDQDVFTLITAASIVDRFDGLTYAGQGLGLPQLGPSTAGYYVGDGLFRVLAYGTEDVLLVNYRALPGDANGDGFVDGSDFGIWNSHKFTAGNSWTTGDFNGDGLTDGSDFGIWNAHKFTGSGLGSGGRTPGGVRIVPEPAASFIIVGATLTLLAARRKMPACT